jgi:hypothetical protein
MRLDKLLPLVERLRSEAIGTPDFVPETHAYVYKEQSAKVVAVLKIIRATQGLATAPGARLPAHVRGKDWVLMPAGSSPLHSDAPRDISVQGYCFFQVSKGK